MRARCAPLLAIVLAAAFCAPFARAEGTPSFMAGKYPADVALEADPAAATQTLVTSLGSITCTKATGKSSLEEEETALKATNLSYSSCHATAFKIPTTIATNGCHYAFSVQTTVSEGVSEGTLDIECTTKKGILVDVNNGNCILEIPGGQHFTGITYRNVMVEGVEAITAEAAISKQIEALYEGACGEGVDEEDSYAGDFTLTATDEAEAATDLTAVPPPEGPADFAAGSYPATVNLRSEGTQTLLTNTGTNYTCVEVEGSPALTGSASIVEQGNGLVVESVEFNHCHATILKIPTTVDVNGCDLTFSSGELIEPKVSAGSVQVTGCEESAKGITITTGTEGKTCHADVLEGAPSSGSVGFHGIGGEAEELTTTAESVALPISTTGGTACSGATGEPVAGEIVYSGNTKLAATESVNFTLKRT